MKGRATVKRGAHIYHGTCLHKKPGLNINMRLPAPFPTPAAGLMRRRLQVAWRLGA